MQQLTPSDISEDLNKGRITKSFAIELLFSIIDASDDPLIREECINAFREIEQKDEKIFKLLENHLISDENPRVRNAAAKLIGAFYIDLGLDSLNWSLSYDKSPIVLSSIQKMIEKQNGLYSSLKQKILHIYKSISTQLGIVIEEARFFLDLEAIFARNRSKYDLNFDEYEIYQKLKDHNRRDFWLRIEKNHVVSLDFNFFNWNYFKERKNLYTSFSKLLDPFIYLETLKKLDIKNYISLEIPNTIGDLKHLKRLTLRDNGIKEVPQTVSNLVNLEYLDLSWNELNQVPKALYGIKSLKSLNLAHNNIHLISNKLTKLSNLQSIKLNDNPLSLFSVQLEDFIESLENNKI